MRTEGLRIVVFIILLTLLSIAACLRNIIWKTDLTLWKDVVIKSPAKERGHYNLGNTYSIQGLLNEAVKEYLTALELKPDFAAAYNNLGNVYSSQGRFDEAIKEYLSAVKLKLDYADAHYNLGSIYKIKGLNDEAIKEFEMVLKIRSDDTEAGQALGLPENK